MRGQKAFSFCYLKLTLKICDIQESNTNFLYACIVTYPPEGFINKAWNNIGKYSEETWIPNNSLWNPLAKTDARSTAREQQNTLSQQLF